MRRRKRAETIQAGFAAGHEGVGHVVQAVAKSVRIKKTEFDSSVCWGWACDLKSILKEAERHKTALEALGIKLTNFI